MSIIEGNVAASKYNFRDYYYAFLCDFYPLLFNNMNMNNNSNIKCSIRECIYRNYFSHLLLLEIVALMCKR